MLACGVTLSTAILAHDDLANPLKLVPRAPADRARYPFTSPAVRALTWHPQGNGLTFEDALLAVGGLPATVKVAQRYTGVAPVRIGHVYAPRRCVLAQRFAAVRSRDSGIIAVTGAVIVRALRGRT
jgi:hypothetical protein